MPRKVEFWFEFASTYSYLSAARIDFEAQKRGVDVRWRPLLLGPIFAAQGWNTSPFNLYPSKGRYMWRDMERRAKRLGLPFNPPRPEQLKNFPQHSVLAARVALIGLQAEWGKAYCRALYAGQFVEHLDIEDPATVAQAVSQAGGGPDAAIAQANAAETKALLRANVDEAVQKGVFGAPSFTIGSELFWGDDRLEDALNWTIDSD